MLQTDQFGIFAHPFFLKKLGIKFIKQAPKLTILLRFLNFSGGQAIQTPPEGHPPTMFPGGALEVLHIFGVCCAPWYESNKSLFCSYINNYYKL